MARCVNNHSNSKGFTLVEILVAIGIIGLLASVAILSITSVRAKVRDVKRIGDIQTTQKSLELYFATKNLYPISGGDKQNKIVLLLGTIGQNSYGVLCDSDQGFQPNTVGCGTIFLNPLPSDPLASVDPTNPYKFGYWSENGSTYALEFNLESGTGTFKSGTRIATPSGIE